MAKYRLTQGKFMDRSGSGPVIKRKGELVELAPEQAEVYRDMVEGPIDEKAVAAEAKAPPKPAKADAIAATAPKTPAKEEKPEKAEDK